MSDVRQADAVMFPEGMFTGSTAEKLPAIHARFGPVLGIAKGWVHPVTPRQPKVYYSPNPGDTVYFAKDHERAGEDRYTWEDQGDGILYGYLVEGAE